MAQLKKTAAVTQGSAAVSIAGNVAAQVKQNFIFMVESELVPYTVATDSVFDGTNTTFSLTGNYAGLTNAAAAVAIATDYTFPDLIPTIAQGDVGTAAIFTRAMYRVQALVSAIVPSGIAETLTAAVQVAADKILVLAARDTAVTKAGEATTAATNATTKAGEAAASATTASTKAGEALASKNAAETANTAAQTAKTAAETANTAAQTAKTAAETGATTATTKAAEASASAGTALTHKTAAETAKTAAETASTAAQTAKTAAEAAYDLFDDRFLGAKAANPTVDNDGNALQIGALYINTGSGEMRWWNGAAWTAAYLPAASYVDLNTAQTLSNKSLTAPAISDPTFTGTVSGVTKTHVGLPNVDNTSDANKPVSTAQAAAIATRANAGGSSAQLFDTASLAVSGELTIVGAGRRIKADFSNATLANRTFVQTSTANGSTIVEVIPNGTSVTSALNLNSGSDPANGALGQIAISNTEWAFKATARGTGVYVPVIFYTTDIARLTIDPSGNIGFNKTANATYKHDFNGFILRTGDGTVNSYVQLGSHATASNNVLVGVESGVFRLYSGNYGSVTQTMQLTAAGELKPVSIYSEPWIFPTLLNSWTNFTGGYATVAYYKDLQGVVHMRGLVANGTIGTVIFTLPAGYRPTGLELFSIVSGSAFGSIQIDTNGGVTCVTGVNSHVSLAGLTFRTV